MKKITIKAESMVKPYKYGNLELNRNLIRLGHKVVKDKKKHNFKYACRGNW